VPLLTDRASIDALEVEIPLPADYNPQGMRSEGFMQRSPVLVALLLAAAPAMAPEPQAAGKPQTFPLWADKAPLARNEKDIPTITVHLPPPEKATGAAVVICPGGGYGALMESYEGHDVAAWLNRSGVAGIVLKYRVRCLHPAPLLDAQRALRTVRARAAEWKLDPGKVGIMGFSAGGHLASTAGTHFDAGDPKASDPVEKAGCRPDFMVLVYPVITMGPKSHGGSRANLLGPNPAPDLVDLLSNEKQVTDRTPPTFLVHSKTDALVSVENSAMFHEALKAHKVPAEFLELPEGAHGLGCGKGDLWAAWQDRCLQWMKSRGLARP
jgi:acetyl esterase/lipase